jgi:hypothetical protein
LFVAAYDAPSAAVLATDAATGTPQAPVTNGRQLAISTNRAADRREFIIFFTKKS